VPSDDDDERAAIQQEPASELPRLLSVAELLKSSAKRVVTKDERKICTTGSYPLDEKTGGLLPGWCWVIGADTNWGKSTWGLAVADENLLLGHGVLIVSAEDSEELYGDRLMLRRSGVNADRFRTKRLNSDELAQVEKVQLAAEDKPVFLDARGKNAEWVAEKVGRIIDSLDVDLVVYDYLQEFRSSRRQQDRRNEVSEVAKMLRDPVKSRSKAAIILSQLTISDKTSLPSKHDIRESRDVSNAAEVVALGFTPEKTVTGNTPSEDIAAGTRCILLDKVKQGRKGIVRLDWDDNAARFRAQRGQYDDLDGRHDGYDDGYSDLDGGLG
jgi:replicative DNA helicase